MMHLVENSEKKWFRINLEFHFFHSDIWRIFPTSIQHDSIGKEIKNKFAWSISYEHHHMVNFLFYISSNHKQSANNFKLYDIFKHYPDKRIEQ